MNNIKVIAYLCSAAVLAACAQQEEPAPMVMSAEPVYNKMGDVVGCTDGRTFTPGAAPMDDPCAPPDECDPNTSSVASINCPPPYREDDDPDRTPDRDPTGRPAG